MDSAPGSVPTWLAAFAPFVERAFRVELRVPITLPAGRMIQDVQAVAMRLPRWTGAPFLDDFGRKAAAMIELDGEHLFAELAVLRLLEKDGWSGRWVSTYSAGAEVWKYLTEWKDVPRDEQRTRPIEDAEPRQLLARIAAFNKPRRYKGCWDTFAWRDSDFAFIQCRRTAPRIKDVLSKDQEEWFRSALYVGDRRVSEHSFCFVQWDFP
ncbi:MAG TPA: hypothetical protein VMN60_02360 [Longimicrobiales bacterium]|nr:hypothetical protein [Longimicrobiales bacterium]